MIQWICHSTGVQLNSQVQVGGLSGGYM